MSFITFKDMLRTVLLGFFGVNIYEGSGVSKGVFL